MTGRSQTAQHAIGNRSPSVELHIEELVLHGFPPLDRHALGGAVERELGRLLAERGVPGWMAGGGEAAAVDGGAFDVAPGARADGIGVKVAQAVCRGLGR